MSSGEILPANDGISAIRIDARRIDDALLDRGRAQLEAGVRQLRTVLAADAVDDVAVEAELAEDACRSCVVSASTAGGAPGSQARQRREDRRRLGLTVGSPCGASRMPAAITSGSATCIASQSAGLRDAAGLDRATRRRPARWQRDAAVAGTRPSAAPADLADVPLRPALAGGTSRAPSSVSVTTSDQPGR